MPRHDTLITNHVADGAVKAHRIVIHGAKAGQAKEASDATKPPIGVSHAIDAADDARLDVHREGIAEIEYGGTVAAGDCLKATADGKAVSTTTANDWCVGVADRAGVTGDIGSAHVRPLRY